MRRLLHLLNPLGRDRRQAQRPCAWLPIRVLALVVGMVMTATSCGEFGDTSSPDDHLIEITTDISRIHRVQPFGGVPKGAWMGYMSQWAFNERVPAPSDYIYYVLVLKYEEPAIVSDMVEGLDGTDGRRPVLAWFPGELRRAADGDELDMTFYSDVPGFGEWRVGVPNDEGTYIIAQWGIPPNLVDE